MHSSGISAKGAVDAPASADIAHPCTAAATGKLPMTRVFSKPAVRTGYCNWIHRNWSVIQRPTRNRVAMTVKKMRHVSKNEWRLSVNSGPLAAATSDKPSVAHTAPNAPSFSLMVSRIAAMIKPAWVALEDSIDQGCEPDKMHGK